MNIRNRFFSLPEIWTMCLGKLYDRSSYVQDLADIMRRCGINMASHILDAGCGTGFPALDLIERGYQVIATDNNDAMLNKFRSNAQVWRIAREPVRVEWSKLVDRFGCGTFDFVYCRGNSLVWADSWGYGNVDPRHAREKIQTALLNFYKILDRGGTLYVDATREDEIPHESDLGVVDTRHGSIRLIWRMDHDCQNKIRTWTIRVRLEMFGKGQVLVSRCYLLSPGELVEMLRTAGFTEVEPVRVENEKNYDVYLAHK